MNLHLRPVGHVSSPLADPADAPRQGDEGAPDCWLVFAPFVADALADLAEATNVVALTWLDRADRDVLTVHPRGDATRPPTGVFSTRSPHRPNPIRLQTVRVLSIDGLRVQVAGLEAVDGTPVLDVKPVPEPARER